MNLKHGWERVKKPVVPRIVLAKFGQDGELGRLLCGTGDAALIEGGHLARPVLGRLPVQAAVLPELPRRRSGSRQTRFAGGRAVAQQSAFNVAPLHTSCRASRADLVAGIVLGIVVFGDSIRVFLRLILLEASGLIALLPA